MKITWENGFKEPGGLFDTTGTIYELVEGEMTRVIGEVFRPAHIPEEKFDSYVQSICVSVNRAIENFGSH